MDYKLELIAIPVTDVDRAKAFYADQLGFTVHHDHHVSDEIRFVQLTPSGSACSIAIGTGTTPGSTRQHPGRPARRPRHRSRPRRTCRARRRGQRLRRPALELLRLRRRPRRQRLDHPAAHSTRLRRSVSRQRPVQPAIGVDAGTNRGRPGCG